MRLSGLFLTIASIFALASATPTNHAVIARHVEEAREVVAAREPGYPLWNREAEAAAAASSPMWKREAQVKSPNWKRSPAEEAREVVAGREPVPQVHGPPWKREAGAPQSSRSETEKDSPYW